MAIDNLISAEVVLASGAVVTASDESEPDLFWAIRGGGGNFGVVTSFEFGAHEVPRVLSGPVLHTADAAPEVLAFYRDFSTSAPDELGTQAALLHAPDGSGAKLCAVAVCHCGPDAERADADVAALRSFGSPAADMIERVPYPVANTGVDWLFERGRPCYWKSAFFSELSDEALDALAAAFRRAPTEQCALVLESFQGAVTRIDPTATAYPHRQPGHNLLLISQWTDPADSDAGIAWARTTFQDLAPYLDERSYTNYLPADDHDRVRSAYGVNYERLVELKRRYDPTNLFHLNQNIDPA
jgi:FAD/FMN-containing dehydrogenase